MNFSNSQKLNLLIDEVEITLHLKKGKNQGIEDTIDLDPTRIEPRIESQISFSEIETRSLTPNTTDELQSEETQITVSNDCLGEVQLNFKAQIGEGGMGVIYCAQQRDLEREVAVKRLKHSNPMLARELILEAQVMGRLTHPNIPPVHLLIEGEDGLPEVVMKRVEGETMLNWLQRAPVRKERLRDSLKIILQICYALEFSHSQNILHRDIKAENVMLGRFNEVYLMDWGLALNLAQSSQAPRGVVGTPAYMAPEMLYGDPTCLSIQTDVYLLGSLLHHALTGQTRHSGKTLELCLKQAFKSEPFNYNSEIPRQLAQLCNRSCNRDRLVRPASVEAFRLDIESFLERWSALEIHSQAVHFRGLYECKLSDQNLNTQEQWRLGYKAKNIFDQALYLAPNLTEAINERDALLEIMIRQAIDQRAFPLAQTLLNEMSPKGKQRAEENKLGDALKHEASWYERMIFFERELDPQLTTEPRLILSRILIGNFIFAILFGYIWLSHKHFELSPQYGFWVGVFGTLPTLLATIALYPRLSVNELGRQATRVILVSIIALNLHRYLSWQLGETLQSMMVSDLLLISLSLLFSKPVLRLSPLFGWLGFVFAFLIDSLSPDYGPILLNTFVLSVGGYILWEWGWQIRKKH